MRKRSWLAVGIRCARSPADHLSVCAAMPGHGELIAATAPTPAQTFMKSLRSNAVGVGESDRVGGRMMTIPPTVRTEEPQPPTHLTPVETTAFRATDTRSNESAQLVRRCVDDVSML